MQQAQLKWLSAAALAAGIAVILGAFAAHQLKDMLSAYDQGVFETAVRYHFYHALALMALSFRLRGNLCCGAVRVTGWLWIAGMLIFCGSLYTMVLLHINAPGEFKWLGAITPIGGTCMILGWLLLAFNAYKTARRL